MKKSMIKKAVRSAMRGYYDKGFTSTGHFVMELICKEIDKVYAKNK